MKVNERVGGVKQEGKLTVGLLKRDGSTGHHKSTGRREERQWFANCEGDDCKVVVAIRWWVLEEGETEIEKEMGRLTG